MQLDEEELPVVEEMFLLTAKPVIYAANIAEADIGNPSNKFVEAVQKKRRKKTPKRLSSAPRWKKNFPLWTKRTRKCF